MSEKRNNSLKGKTDRLLYSLKNAKIADQIQWLAIKRWSKIVSIAVFAFVIIYLTIVDRTVLIEVLKLLPSF